MKFLNNNKQADLFNNNTICIQLQNCYIIYFEKNKKLQKETKYKTKIYTKINTKTSYKNVQNNIDKNVTSKNQHNINRYLFEQANTKIDNKCRIAHREYCYNKNNAIYSRQFDF